MSVILVTAVIECDACGNQFKVFLDEAHTGGSVRDAAEHAVLAGNLSDGVGSCSLKDGAMLCPECTAEDDGT